MTHSHRAPGFLKIAHVALVPVICMIGLLFSEQRAGAIVGGAPTGVQRARNVGTLVVSREGEPWVWAGCGVTLISPKVGVTAGHCIAFAYRRSSFTRIGVSFASEHVIGAPLPAELEVHEGSDALHPEFKAVFGGGLSLQNPKDPALADVGAIVFNQPIRGVPAAHLPKEAPLVDKDGLFDTPFDNPFDVGLVSYGATSFAALTGKEPFDGGTRRFTTMAVDRIYPAVITLSPAPGDTCAFDSGGPAFNTVNGHVPPVVVTVLGIIVGPAGTRLCDGGTTIMRVDVPHVSRWLRALTAAF